MKNLFILLVSIPISLNMTAQDTTIVCINNKKVAEAVIHPDQNKAASLIIKSAYKKYDPFIIEVSGEHVKGEVYKRTLKIGEENSIEVDETKDKPGYFDITKTDTGNRLTAGKPIPLYLVLNPANPLMMIPSRIVFLGNLVMK